MVSIEFIIKSICKFIVIKFDNNFRIFRSYKYVAKIDGIHNLVDIWECCVQGCFHWFVNINPSHNSKSLYVPFDIRDKQFLSFPEVL